ncbi:MAG: glycine--tRNA ligase subunit beta [Pseudomonadota bacterium]
MPDLLIELFSEEIPARMQARAASDLKKRVTDGISDAGLTYASAGAFATPRRLTLSVEQVIAQSPRVIEERKGPRVDAPDQALQGFLRATGLAVDQLEARETSKGSVWFAKTERPGRAAAEIVAEVLEDTIRSFPWPKAMRWGSGNLRWVRPLHRVLCILSDEGATQVVPVDIDGIQSSDLTEGHRFMAPGPFPVRSFDDYTAKLRAAWVMLDPAERQNQIRNEAENLTFAAGLELVADKGLLAEVAGLVEWPFALMGDIGSEFLELPSEVLQTSMREHQKFFSVRNPASGRIERFITVANRQAADHGATILKGNAKVLAARLSDAKFFWENDLRDARTDIEVWLRVLSEVTFHAKLGSQADRIDRIAQLARQLAPDAGATPAEAERAARLAKADLSSAMVYEFPELQGTMGRYYALEAGETDAVADAARDHWGPLGPSDDVPDAPVTVAVALADKIDTLTGFWAIDEKPTGSKDPYALRRAALGVARIILSNGLRISLTNVIAHAGRLLEGAVPEDWRAEGYSGDLLAFLHDRLKVSLREEGVRHDVIDASLAMPGGDDLSLLVARARALQDVLGTDNGENLLQGFKRANNILSQAEAKDGVEYSYGPDPKLAEGPEEEALFTALAEAERTIGPALASEDFARAMAAMAAMRPAIDAFFEAVQVNANNAMLRRNRLNILHKIRATCSSVADLTRIQS